MVVPMSVMRRPRAIQIHARLELLHEAFEDSLERRNDPPALTVPDSTVRLFLQIRNPVVMLHVRPMMYILSRLSVPLYSRPLCLVLLVLLFSNFR